MNAVKRLLIGITLVAVVMYLIFAAVNGLNSMVWRDPYKFAYIFINIISAFIQSTMMDTGSKHECDFSGEKFVKEGITFQKCTHPGCRIVNPLD